MAEAEQLQDQVHHEKQEHVFVEAQQVAVAACMHTKTMMLLANYDGNLSEPLVDMVQKVTVAVDALHHLALQGTCVKQTASTALLKLRTVAETARTELLSLISAIQQHLCTPMDMDTKGEIRVQCETLYATLLSAVDVALKVKVCEEMLNPDGLEYTRPITEVSCDVSLVVSAAIGEDTRLLVDSIAQFQSSVENMCTLLETETSMAQWLSEQAQKIGTGARRFQLTRAPAAKRLFEEAVNAMEEKLRCEADAALAEHSTSEAPISASTDPVDLSDVSEGDADCETAVAEEAAAILDLVREQFPVFKMEWQKRTEEARDEFTSKLMQVLQQREVSSVSRRSSGNLEDLIRQRGMGDLARMTHLLPEVVGSGSNAATIEGVLVRVAEATMELIIVANTLVLKPSLPDDALRSAVTSLYLAIADAVRGVPTAIAQDEQEAINESLTELAEGLIEQSKDATLFKEDEFVKRAAEKGEGKLIEGTLKSQLWDRCNSLRILVIYLFCTLRGVWDQNYSCRSLLYQIIPTVRKAGECAADLAGTVMTTRTVMAIAAKARAADRISMKNVVKVEPIWDAYEGAKEQQLAETAVDSDSGSLNLLVIALTSDKNYDTNFISTFITTYRSFTTPRELFEKLLERFNVLPGKLADAGRTTAIQWRVAVVIKHWVETQFYDFDDDLIEELFGFVDSTLFNAGHTAMAQALHEKLNTKLKDRKKRLAAMISVPPTDLMMPRDIVNPAHFFMNITDEEIARQMTLIDFGIYGNIQVQELLKTSWSSDKLKHRSPHVCSLLGRLNNIAFFVPSLILWQETKAQRALMIEKFIRVAKLLQGMNNFHTMMGLVTGLNVSGISRLKFSMAEVDSKLLAHFKKIESVMDPSSAFKNYRKAIRAAMMPALPYLGVYLTDLTFIEDGNPDMIQAEGGEEINFAKRKMVFKVIQEVLLYQQRPYTFPSVDPIRTFLLSFPHGNDKSLYKLSLAHEPRAAVSTKEIR